MDLAHDSTRRNALQQMITAIMGVSLFSVSGCNSQKTSSTTQSQNTNKLSPFYVAPTEPLQPGPGGIDIRTLVRSSQTNGQFSCVEFAVAPKKMGPAPHYHKELDELMYVLEGTATIMVEDTIYEIPAGGWHLRPRGIVHTFFNNTDKPFRGVDMYFNQNFEDYLEEMIHKIVPEMVAQKLTPHDPSIAKRIHDLHEKFGMVGYPEKRQAIIEKFGLLA